MIRMMLVDDEERIVNSLYGYLRGALDIEIYRAYSGAQAIALLESMRFDLVMTDIAMPGMNGLELMKRIKREWPFCHVILLTAHGDFNYTYQALHYDQVDYLLKIEDYETILATVQKHVAAIEAEVAKQSEMLRMSADLEKISAGLNRLIIRREVILGTQAAEETLQAFRPDVVSRARPTLLLVCRMEENSLLHADDALQQAAAFLRRELQPLGVEVFDFTLDACAALLLQTDGEEKRLLAHITETAETLLRQSEERASGRLTIAMSDHFAAWESLHAQYRTALLLIDRMEPGGLKLFSEESENAERSPTYPAMEELNALWEFLRQGKQEECLSAFDAGTAFLDTQAPPSVAAASALRTAIAFLALSAQQTFGADDALAAQAALWQQPRSLSGRQLRQRARAMLCRLFERRAAAQQDMGQWLVRRIDAFIQAHYQEDISLTLIAADTHYSPAYISRFYKMHTGKNILNHLNEVRINAARQLLIGTNLKISDIAAQTGFCSAKYFNQSFKKQTGLTPAEFRSTAT